MAARLDPTWLCVHALSSIHTHTPSGMHAYIALALREVDLAGSQIKRAYNDPSDAPAHAHDMAQHGSMHCTVHPHIRDQDDQGDLGIAAFGRILDDILRDLRLQHLA